MLKYTHAIELGQNGLLEKIPGTKYWIVKKEFVWYLDYSNKKEKVVVPVGLRTDFGSIPRFLWSFFDKTKYISYILHDYLYGYGCLIESTVNEDEVRIPTRKEVDTILIEAMAVEKAKKREMIFIYLGIRIWGWLFFKK